MKMGQGESVHLDVLKVHQVNDPYKAYYILLLLGGTSCSDNVPVCGYVLRSDTELGLCQHQSWPAAQQGGE